MGAEEVVDATGGGELQWLICYGIRMGNVEEWSWRVGEANDDERRWQIWRRRSSMGVLDGNLHGELDGDAGQGARRGCWTGSSMETSTGSSSMGPWTGSSPGTSMARSCHQGSHCFTVKRRQSNPPWRGDDWEAPVSFGGSVGWGDVMWWRCWFASCGGFRGEETEGMGGDGVLVRYRKSREGEQAERHKWHVVVAAAEAMLRHFRRGNKGWEFERTWRSPSQTFAFHVNPVRSGDVDTLHVQKIAFNDL
jgi:hypothetical protein